TSDFSIVVEILKTAANARVAEEGCRIVNMLTLDDDDDDNQAELGRLGACDAVVKALKRFGAENANVVEQGCGAVWNLAVDDDNKKELGRVGACDAVVKALKRF